MRLISNFHTHTSLCHHATGTPYDYTAQATKEGCTALGFSDHCPYPENFFDCWQGIRMTTKEADLYTHDIEKAKISAHFPIFQGFECEWEKSYGSWYEDLKADFHADYLILGSHWVTSGERHIYIPEVKDNSLLNAYIDQTIDGMRSGLFSFLAHPDLFMTNRDWDEQAKACSKAIIDAAVSLNLPLEINGLGITKTPNDTAQGARYPYPRTEFWELASQSNVRIICNSDAHSPLDVIINAWRARDFASRFGFKPIDLPDFCTC